MPIYQYQCQQCGEVSEFRVPITLGSETFACRSCGSESMDRLITAPGLLKTSVGHGGTTCCGRTERCDRPPCSNDSGCHRG